jgi:xylan 1,4-beta-xylosidase
MKPNAAASRLGWLTILIIATCIPRPAHAQIRTETIEIDPRAETQPFPHYWERMFGSGRAILSLRESYRRDLRAVKQAIGFEYVRFHAILHDEVGLYDL